jgi:hypothetical protein
VLALLGLEGNGFDRLPECKELLFRVAHQRNEDMPVAATASAKTTHDLRESRREGLGLGAGAWWAWDGPV